MATEQTKRCPKCGYDYEPWVDVCHACGTQATRTRRPRPTAILQSQGTRTRAQPQIPTPMTSLKVGPCSPLKPICMTSKTCGALTVKPSKAGIGPTSNRQARNSDRHP